MPGGSGFAARDDDRAEFVDVRDFLSSYIRVVRVERKPCYLVSLQLDRFMRLREWWGDDVADQVGTVIAGRLAMKAGGAHRVKFVSESRALIQLPKGSGGDADPFSAAWDLMEFIAADITVVAGTPISVGSMIGIVDPDSLDVLTPGFLLSAATTAMSQAVGLGARRVRVYDGAMGATGRIGVLGRDLNAGLRKDQLHPWYQPKYRVVDGSLAGFESLIRWNHPLHGEVSPADFLAEAEHSGLVRDVDKASCLHVLSRIAKLEADGALPPSPFAFSVNLSAASLDDPRLPGLLSQALGRAGVDPARLILEITETTIAASPDLARARLRGLRDLGVHLSLDDFGAGHAFFNLLGEGLFSELKVDRSLVHGWDGIPPVSVIRPIVDLARAVGMSVVAEGIETPEQLSAATEAGCDLVQGYLLSGPVPGMELHRVLRAGGLAKPS
jgi:EAL domain-containing protein (putative c-di-GMP-specific phosphodiesterase class I)